MLLINIKIQVIMKKIIDSKFNLLITNHLSAINTENILGNIQDSIWFRYFTKII